MLLDYDLLLMLLPFCYLTAACAMGGDGCVPQLQKLKDIQLVSASLVFTNLVDINLGRGLFRTPIGSQWIEGPPHKIRDPPTDVVCN